ncbi:MAG: redoxin domain-containing protein, partial [Myxococcota bacterium]
MIMADAMMKNVDGQMISLGKAKGPKGTLVIFSCNHCPYVKAWETRIASAGNAAQKMGFGVVAINANDPKPYPEDGFDEMKAR